MTFQTFRLQPYPESGFHFGRQGRALETTAETLASDSLFAALVVTYKETHGAVDEFLAPWENRDPPFLLSSMFPFAGELPLLPLPRLPVRFGQVDPRSLKKLKKIKYVSPHIFSRLLAHELMDDAWANGPRTSLQDGAVWLDGREQQQLPAKWRRLKPELLHETTIWATDTVPRVTVARPTSSSTIYFAGRTVFAEACGLWFLADVRRQPELLSSLLAEISQVGIGGERSAGYGAFTLGDPLPLPSLPPPVGTDQVLTLARYHPRPDEIEAGVLGPAAAYEIVTVGGWLATAGAPAERRRRVRLLEAGSVLDVSNGAQLSGQLVDVRPSYGSGRRYRHAVYRNGYAFPIGVRKT